METIIQDNLKFFPITNNSLYPKEKLLEILQNTFGFKKFRAGQLSAIQTLLQQGRLLCIQPTGHGKSLLYQLPSVLLPGVTIVISPLLALMRDQIEQLNNRFKISAASINSDQSETENQNTRQSLIKNKIKILFVAPEQLGNLEQFEFLSKLSISLIVVDEAHCISSWGHDFRPEYREILNFIVTIEAKNPDVKILGLTATADHHTEQDIKQQLSTIHKAVIVHRESMARPNIALSVIFAANQIEKLALCEKLICNFSDNLEFKPPRNGLIYCATRENTELVADYLKTVGIKAEYYHAGLEPERKKQLQQAFISDKYSVLVATNALGMGIDKQNLRYIIHYDFPGSITAYYQEVGRCGRDGDKASGILLYCPQDKKIQKYFINAALPVLEDFNRILAVLQGEALNLTSIKTRTGLHPTRVTVVVSELVQQDFLKKCSINGKQIYQRIVCFKQLDISRYETLFHNKTTELNKMVNYCQQNDSCRMLLLRHQLGEPEAKEQCEQCDVCKKLNPALIEQSKLIAILDWQDKRLTPINLGKSYNTLEEFALFDASARSPLFISFMKSRSAFEVSHKQLLETIINKLEPNIKSLQKKMPITAALVIPSSTWTTRALIANQLQKRLKVPFLLDALQWRIMPSARQGELLNNDQRRENVHNKMQYHANINSSGAILLFDDYIGSGATMKEAIRAIRANRVKQTIIPITIAAVKWKLGQKGMV